MTRRRVPAWPARGCLDADVRPLTAEESAARLASVGAVPWEPTIADRHVIAYGMTVTECTGCPSCGWDADA